MAKHIENEIVRYYDLYPTREDLMGETYIHRILVEYLMDLLRWLFHGQHCALYANLNFYQTPEYREEPLAPDIAIIQGVDVQEVTSWYVGKTGPAPQVIFEIGSAGTWKNDLDDKPQQYAHMGVHEYFAYDPNKRPLRRGAPSRLFGWQLDRVSNEMRVMPLRSDGSLWSTHLNSRLVPDGPYLRLYDQYGNLLLTRAEATERRADAEAAMRRIETERAKALAEKLRSLGIDPDRI